MSGEIVSIAGLLLTTVFGGFLGYLFQQRRWDADRRESERGAATEVFSEVSQLMDRRLYRMWLLYWATLGGRDDALAALQNYRSILNDWNENLNRNLALVRRYFGVQAWMFLDRTIYEAFKQLGAVLESRFRNQESDKSDDLEAQLRQLSDVIYEFDRCLISFVQTGDVGIYRHDKNAEDEVPPWDSLAAQPVSS